MKTPRPARRYYSILVVVAGSTGRRDAIEDVILVAVAAAGRDVAVSVGGIAVLPVRRRIVSDVHARCRSRDHVLIR